MIRRVSLTIRTSSSSVPAPILILIARNPLSTERSSSPQRDTAGGTANTPGQVDTKRVKDIADVWGKLPEKERARAMVELTRGLPAKDRAVIEEYFRKLQQMSGNK